MAKHLVRVTQEPGIVREVDDAELLDLHRSGILHSFEHTDAASAVLGDDVKSPAKWKAAKEGEEIVTPPPATTDPTAGSETETKGA